MKEQQTGFRGQKSDVRSEKSGPSAPTRQHRPTGGLRTFSLGFSFFLKPLALSLITLSASAQSIPLEINQDATAYNIHSIRGVPISSSTNSPVGSDGRAPTTSQQQTAGLTLLPPSPGQFQGVMSFGRSSRYRPVNGSGNFITTPAATTNANGVPVGKDGTEIKVRLLMADIGAPVVLRQNVILFGGVVPLPNTDENGVEFTNTLASDYWRLQPHFHTGQNTNNHIYWSPHAQRVFGVEPGRTTVTWRRVAGLSSAPAGTNGVNYVTEAGLYFPLFTTVHVISGRAIKETRKIYWTKGSGSGPAVDIPQARVSEVKIVYHSAFPQNVATDEAAAIQTGPSGIEIKETRTLWVEGSVVISQIHALNANGRVFVELLGDDRVDGNKVHLGFEVVDVQRQPNPADVAIDLGERITAWQDGRDDSALNPSIVSENSAAEFFLRHTGAGQQRATLYAIRDTTPGQNDLLIHWLEEGVAGLRWPFRFTRNTLHWPVASAKYSHYVRPSTATDAEAKATAIQLPQENVPEIQHQDFVAANELRGKLDGFEFYTRLDSGFPAHRTLLSFRSGEHIRFERVFSWLDTRVISGAWAGNTIATSLDEWDSSGGAFNFADQLKAPRVVTQTVDVGTRILAPAGEIGAVATNDYLAGHIKPGDNTCYHPAGYVDPLVSGFEAANQGVIIPVNAVPGKELLEVWWFRDNQADAARGFKTIYWPAAIGRYTVQWPTSPREIVLASNDGSGPLSSLEARGKIYYENDSSETGYNPNEEHALMLGGQAFALRDDLNVTSETDYSSDPFVLLEYTESDGRLAISPFKVLREKPDAGITFDFAVTAGQIIQPPMPLGLLPKPIPDGETESLNLEVGISTVTASTVPINHEVTITTDEEHRVILERTYALQNPDDLDATRSIYIRQADYDAKTVTGVISDVPPVALLPWSGVPPADTDYSRYAVENAVIGYSIGTLVLAVRNESKQSVWVQLQQSEATQLYVDIEIPTEHRAAFATGVSLVFPDSEITADQFDGWTLLGEPVPATAPPALRQFYGRFTFQDRKGDVWVHRGPHDENTPRSLLTVQYYYKTQAGFHFPSSDPHPEPGTITPYLRIKNDDGTFVGNAVEATTTTRQALPITYHPVWPEAVPELHMAESLTLPKRGLPAVRGQTSMRVLYQQSQTESTPVESVVLHDPTREKEFQLGASGGNTLDKIPGSVATQAYQGKTYFPNLPPHLSERFFLDPDRGVNGKLVFKGEFVDETVGEDYLLLNVLGTGDLATLKGLCSTGDADKAKWDSAIGNLTTTLELFVEDPATPGVYVSASSVKSKLDDGAYADIDEAADQEAEDYVSVVSKATDLLATVPNKYKIGEARTAIVSAAIDNADVAVDSYALTAIGPGTGYVTLIAGNGRAFTPGEEPVSVHIVKVVDTLHPGEVKVILSSNPLSEKLTMQQVVDLAGNAANYDFEWRYAFPVDGLPPAVAQTDNPGADWLALETAEYLDGVRAIVGGTANVRTLSDQYLIMRYKPTAGSTWSGWTTPQLAEGWIKRVLGGINPFNQRVTDLFNNQVNTDASILTQAGKRWEGDVALNLDSINDFGLIEIYETVLRRGRGLSIDAGINFGPANDALLLAAGYLNDLYMLVGNEALADAANPTIGIGTKDGTFGDIATALFAFKGQMPSLLEEELALLRGRDDFVQPGTDTAPVYNRMFWNYTRGIDSGEVIYALNYNIQEDQGAGLDGTINAADAAKMFPQGHGDADGHYLTAVKGYYQLLTDNDFTWVPRTEAVTVLGKAVQVDYQDERKFAAAAAALAGADRQVFDLTWRKDYQAGDTVGWEHFSDRRTNTRPEPDTTRYWGLDHWAARTGQGSFINWVVGNSILPDVDDDPDHQGIQKVDRTTVPELIGLADVARDLQDSLDKANARLNPLGLNERSIAFDLNPGPYSFWLGGNSSHFDQIHERAVAALNNAVIAFDDAKDVTRLMRSEQDSLNDFQAQVDEEELAFKHALIEIYGTPYADDIGPGKTYVTDYDGPDLAHFMYVDLDQIPGLDETEEANEVQIIQLDKQDKPDDWDDLDGFDFIHTSILRDTKIVVLDGTAQHTNSNETVTYNRDTDYVEFSLGPHGFFDKPSTWTGKRKSPGEIQQAISDIIAAHTAASLTLGDSEDFKYFLDREIEMLKAQVATRDFIRKETRKLNSVQTFLEIAQFAGAMYDLTFENALILAEAGADTIKTTIPRNAIFGLANGGDVGAPVQGAVQGAKTVALGSLIAVNLIKSFALGSLELAFAANERGVDFNLIEPVEFAQANREAILGLDMALDDLQDSMVDVNLKLRTIMDKRNQYAALVAKGNRLQTEREIFRKRASAIVQGVRTRDAAFRIFRNEKLERYKTLFDLAAKYAFLAAQAYDYETGLLHTDNGKAFINKIINARALGVVADGQPQFAGSNTGDPGLSSALAEMKADWGVLKGRLGFNNPDTDGTTVSLRMEKHRIVPGSDGDDNWKDLLNRGRMANVLADGDVVRYCMQIDRGDDLPVPGIVLDFGTMVVNGLNLFGRPLAGGDHNFTPSTFATKIFSVGVALEGYVGMDDPSANSSTTGGSSPSDPSAPFLGSQTLAATPYVYLIPVGTDAMRSPPLGDQSVIRVWNVDDVAIPLPFNIGASDFSNKKLYQSADSLTEQLFAIRKHQAFRPVSDTSKFPSDSGQLLPSDFTNSRLIGRSIWNSKWKLVIPGHALLNDPDEGLDRFIETVKDIKLHFETISYSGN